MQLVQPDLVQSGVSSPGPFGLRSAPLQQPVGPDGDGALNVQGGSPGAAAKRPRTPPAVPAPAAAPPSCGVRVPAHGGGGLGSAQAQREAEAVRTSTSAGSGHPLQHRGDLVSSVVLVGSADFEALAAPLPRCQDLPPHVRCGPEAGDVVVAVSHAWSRQAHPDPLGAKRDEIVRLLRGSPCKVFLDFTGVPQRPFAPGQAPRTPGETRTFEAALHCMHEVYFYSDRVVHLSEPGEPGVDVLKQEAARFVASVEELSGAEFGQIGDWVQVTGLRAGSAGAGGGTCRLFDRVVSIAGAAVTSLVELRAGLQSAGAQVTLERYPYGRINSVPADQRGWVFLERFITMVKCAMLDAEEAEEVVLTDSEAIRAQIMTGADRLREAARHLRGADGSAASDSELHEVLEGFVAELAAKRFSAASTDKLLIDAATQASRCAEPPSDAEVVRSVMERFAALLATKWLEEEGKQRRRASGLRLLRRAAVSYLTTWNSVSPDYMERLEAGGSHGCWQLLSLLLVPPTLVSALVLQPLPPADVGPSGQWEFWTRSAPLVPLFCLPFFPKWFSKMLQLDATWTLELKCIGWCLVTGGLTCVALPAIAFAAGTFPVPLHLLINALILGVMLPLLALLPPMTGIRRLRKQIIAAASICVLVVVVFGEGFPLLNAVLKNAEPGWQVLITPVFLIAKLAVEFVTQRLCRFLSPDVLPNATWFAAVVYELNFCITLADSNNWLVATELLAFDAAENLFHLLSLRRIHRRRESSPEDARCRCVGITIALLQRELAEVLMPTCFLLELYLVRRVQPQYNDIVCGIAEEEFRQMLLMLALDIAAQLAVAAASCAAVRRAGLPPLRLLRGIVASTFLLNLLAVMVPSVYYKAMEHSHFGMDLSFRFSWAGDRAAASAWDCGLQWRAL